MTAPILYRGHEAIEAAERGEAVRLCKYSDPTERAREDITIDEARDVAREDVGLIYAVAR